MLVRKSTSIVVCDMNMEAPYKDIYLTYRKEVKPLIARIESERSLIPEHIVPDTAAAFENIALSEDSDLGEAEKEEYVSAARQAMLHCLAGCYNQLMVDRLGRVKKFIKRAEPSFLLAIDKGNAYNAIHTGLEQFEMHYQQCDTSERVSRKREMEDLPHYKAAYEALEVPYGIVRSYEPHIIINRTATPRKLTLVRETAIALGQCILWGLLFEAVVIIVQMVIS